MLMVPRALVDRLAPDAPPLHGRMMTGASGRMLAEHMFALARHLPEMTMDDVPPVERATTSLLSAALGALPQNDSRPFSRQERGVEGRVLAHIERGLTDPGLPSNPSVATLPSAGPPCTAPSSPREGSLPISSSGGSRRRTRGYPPTPKVASPNSPIFIASAAPPISARRSGGISDIPRSARAAPRFPRATSRACSKTGERSSNGPTAPSSVVNLKSAIVWTQFGGNICPLMEVDDGATSSGIGVDGIGA